VESVEHREEALARHGEDSVAALNPELIDEDSSAHSGSGAFGHAVRLAALRCRVTIDAQA
jgi:hypothetical protein